MTPEGLDELERRVTALLEHYRAARDQIRQLETRAESNEREGARLGAENEHLRARLAEVENELASRTSREDVVRNRLQQLLGQITTLEAEITKVEGAGHESG